MLPSRSTSSNALAVWMNHIRPGIFSGILQSRPVLLAEPRVVGWSTSFRGSRKRGVYGNVSSTLKQLIIGAMPASDPATFSGVNDNRAVSVCAKTNRGDLKDIQSLFFNLPIFQSELVSTPYYPGCFGLLETNERDRTSAKEKCYILTSCYKSTS